MLSSRSTWRSATTRVAGVMALALVLAFAPPRARAACVGDCHGDGEVTVDEIIVMVNVALETAQLTSCPSGDENGDGRITVDEIIAAVNNLLSGCPFEATPTPTATAVQTVMPTSTPTEASTPTLTATAEPPAMPTSTLEPSPPSTLTPTAEPSATATPTATEAVTATATPSPTQNGVLSVADAVARDADGASVHLGQTVTTEGVVTVAAGIFANNKLKVFVQDGGAGIMVYHQSSAAVDAFQPGQRLRVTGVIRQQDPTSDANPATGTVLIDITQGSVSVVSDGNPIPDPQPVTLATLNASGTAYTGLLVRVDGVRKISGDWPAAGSKSTQVTISDDGGTNSVVLRLQRNTITTQLAQKVSAIGNGSFTLVGIVLQDDENADGKLLTNFEIWLRGADDVVNATALPAGLPNDGAGQG